MTAARGLLLVLVSLLFVSFCDVARAENIPASESTRALLPGPYAVGHMNLTLTDTSRPTAPNKTYKGSPVRVLETSIWYPADARSFEFFRIGAPPVAKAGGAHPLIVYSHGFMSFNTECKYLAEHLASLGYIVVAATYPLTSYGAPGGPNVIEVASQPGDVAFLITTLLTWSSTPTHQFAGAIDPSRIGVAGVSLGGMTSTLATFHPSMKDPRIAAAVSIAGPSSMFGPVFYQAAPKPYMMIASEMDAVVYYDTNAEHLQDRAPFATLVTMHGASHTGHADIAGWLFALANNPDSLGCSALMQNIKEMPSNGVLTAALGGPEQGLVPGDPRLPCGQKDLPRSMRPAREHDLVTLAVTAFFQSQFAELPATRDANLTFLRTTLPKENAEVVVAPPKPTDVKVELH